MKKEFTVTCTVDFTFIFNSEHEDDALIFNEKTMNERLKEVMNALPGSPDDVRVKNLKVFERDVD